MAQLSPNASHVQGVPARFADGSVPVAPSSPEMLRQAGFSQLELRERLVLPAQRAIVSCATNSVIMPRPARDDRLDKFPRFRTDRKAAGMKPVRISVPDASNPTFAVAARREADLLRGAPEEQEALDFIEAAMRDLDNGA